MQLRSATKNEKTCMILCLLAFPVYSFQSTVFSLQWLTHRSIERLGYVGRRVVAIVAMVLLPRNSADKLLANNG